jgi:hypothetical protein
MPGYSYSESQFFGEKSGVQGSAICGWHSVDEELILRHSEKRHDGETTLERALVSIIVPA